MCKLDLSSFFPHNFTFHLNVSNLMLPVILNSLTATGAFFLEMMLQPAVRSDLTLLSDVLGLSDLYVNYCCATTNFEKTLLLSVVQGMVSPHCGSTFPPIGHKHFLQAPRAVMIIIRDLLQLLLFCCITVCGVCLYLLSLCKCIKVCVCLSMSTCMFCIVEFIS